VARGREHAAGTLRRVARILLLDRSVAPADRLPNLIEMAWALAGGGRRAPIPPGIGREHPRPGVGRTAASAGNLSELGTGSVHEDVVVPTRNPLSVLADIAPRCNIRLARPEDPAVPDPDRA
jgi:hypothetical protein